MMFGMAEPITFSVQSANQEKAMVLLHGYHGDSHLTFGMLPAFLAGDPRLYGWDLYCLGYPTGLMPDVSGVWSADPDLASLSGYLTTAVSRLCLARYARLVLIAHSMGGLIVQRALLDGGFTDRISHVLLFGTPSNGLRKASLWKLFKRQARDMTYGSDFITKLRKDWDEHFAKALPFALSVIAGTQDEFVPEESSLTPFPVECHARVYGDHLRIVKPLRTDDDTPVLLVNNLTKDRNRVLLSAESRRDQDSLRVDVTDDISVTDSVSFAATSEAIGIQAGDLKRKWLANPDGREPDGRHAHELYVEAFRQAERENDHRQAAYNGINAAFMALARQEDYGAAQELAKQVRAHSEVAPQDRWRHPTEGEACLYLRDPEQALRHYALALEGALTPQELGSMERQALWAARLMQDVGTEIRLRALFDEHRR